MHDRSADTIETRARLTPYELVFGDGSFESTSFPRIREEADQRGVDTSAPERFVMLGTAGALLHELRAPVPTVPRERAAAGSATNSDARADAIAQYAALLFQAYNFREAGQPLYVLSESAARIVMDDVAPGARGSGRAAPGRLRFGAESLPRQAGDWRLVAPAPSGYLQLPRHLVWTAVQPDAAPEPVDGFFWTLRSPSPAGFAQRLHVLLCLGMRRGRPGLSAIDLAADVPERPAHWADIEARPGGGDFANVLPGGEMDRLYALTTAAEAFKLASRCFLYMDLHSDRVRGAGVASSTTPASLHELPGSALPHHVIAGAEDG